MCGGLKGEGFSVPCFFFAFPFQLTGPQQSLEAHAWGSGVGRLGGRIRLVPDSCEWCPWIRHGHDRAHGCIRRGGPGQLGR